MLLLLPLATGFLGVLIVYVVFQIRKIIEDEQSVNIHRPNLQNLWKSFPINSGNGWSISSVQNGITIWWHKETNPTLQHGIFGCQTLVQASSEVVIMQLLQPKVLALTDTSVDDVHIIPNHGSKSSAKDGAMEKIDCLLLTERENTCEDLFDLKLLYIHWKHKHKVKRIWSKRGADSHSLMLSPENYLYAHKFGTCSIFLVKELQGTPGNGLTLLTLLAVPYTNERQHTDCLLKRMSRQILCLREHLDSLCLSKMLGPNASDKQETANDQSSMNANPECDAVRVPNDAKGSNDRKYSNSGAEEQPATIQHVSMQESEASPTVVIPNAEVQEYADFIKSAFDDLYEIHKADGSTPGWSFQGNTKGVDVYRKAGDSSCPPDCYKGTTDIAVPLAYALQYCVSVDYKLDWDDIYAGGAIVKDLDGLTKVSHLDYKSVWPTAGRYFISLSSTRHIKDHLYGVCVKGIDFPFPEVKGKVRGEIIIGGFLIEEVTADPPCCRVTYVTRADLKGSVPSRLVNKVSSAQPLYMIKVREKMEERLANEDPPMNNDILQMLKTYPSIYESPRQLSRASVDIPHVANEKASSASLPRGSSESSLEQKVEAVGSGESGLLLSEGLTLSRRNFSEDDVSISSYSSMETLTREYSPSEFKVDSSPIIDFDLPRDQRGHIDFITLGNQASATLLEEALLVSKVTLEQKQANDVGEWVYQGEKKNVKMFRKIHEKESIHSFLGFGYIHVLPTKVWEAVKNPASRFMYDSMLKKTKIVKEVYKGYKIVHMRHETTACFVRQARDFVILTSERTEGNKYVLSGISVDLPECAPGKDCVRGRVLSSGWIIEPVLKGGKPCSQVTYLSQVNFGGSLPIRLVNHIAKRQPMSVAYLRDYLESNENR